MTNRRRATAVVSLALLLALVIIPAQSTLAAAPAAGISLTTSPISLDLTIKPGTSTTKTLQVMNNGSQALQMHMEVQVFSAHGNSGQAAITQAPSNDPSSGWVHFSPSSFVAQPGVWTPVKTTISLPKTAQLGYYYAVIFKPDIPTQAVTPKTNILKGSNAILVLVDTGSSNESRQVQIANFSVSKGVYEYLPATFNISIHNGGNIYLAPSGNIFISRHADLTHTIASLNVNSSRGNVLPDSVRNFSLNWADGFPAFQPKGLDGKPITNKNGQPVQQLKWDFTKVNHFRFGKYYAQLVLLYNNGHRNVVVTSVVSFWVIPWKLLIVTGIVVIILSIGLWSIGRNLIKRIRKVRRPRR